VEFGFMAGASPGWAGRPAAWSPKVRKIAVYKMGERAPSP
jgi:hypothetical protein